jgi:hypothetical protein
MPGHNEQGYGKLLHSDFDPEESAEKQGTDLFFGVGMILMLAFFLVIIAGMFILDPAPVLAAIFIVFLVMMAPFIYALRCELVVRRTVVQLYERAIIEVDRKTDAELKRYDIADIVVLFLNPTRNYLGLVLQGGGRRFFEQLPRRHISNEPHFLQELRTLGVTYEPGDMPVGIVQRLVSDFNERAGRT